jgi:hypothetical protein
MGESDGEGRNQRGAENDSNDFARAVTVLNLMRRCV